MGAKRKSTGGASSQASTKAPPAKRAASVRSADTASTAETVPKDCFDAPYMKLFGGWLSQP